MLNYVALDKVFKALGHRWRRYIVECLCEGEASVSWLALNLPLGLPTILKHLQILEKYGLIRTEKVGRERICNIEARGLALLDQWMTPRRKLWDRRLQQMLAAGAVVAAGPVAAAAAAGVAAAVAAHAAKRRRHRGRGSG